MAANLGQGQNATESSGNYPRAHRSSMLKKIFAVLIAVGMASLGIMISVTMGLTTIVGFLFGLPFIIAAFIFPYFMLRREKRQQAMDRINGTCPYCGTLVSEPGHIRQTNCPMCGRKLVVEGNEFRRVA